METFMSKRPNAFLLKLVLRLSPCFWQHARYCGIFIGVHMQLPFSNGKVSWVCLEDRIQRKLPIFLYFRSRIPCFSYRYFWRLSFLFSFFGGCHLSFHALRIPCNVFFWVFFCFVFYVPFLCS